MVESSSRRDFLHCSFQIGIGAALGAMAGCLGIGGSEDPSPIANISFAPTGIVVEITEAAVGTTINLLLPNSNEPVQHWTVRGGRTSIRFSLLEKRVKYG